MTSFLQIKRVYESNNNLSINLLDVLPDRLTVDPSYIATMHQTSHQTAFKEVTIHRQTPYTYLDSSLQYEQLPKDAMIRRLYRELMSGIIQQWRSDKLKIVYHSSGYDSRLLSTLIKQLHIENGDDWLGDVIFVCTKWEGDEFKVIMEHQGWESHQWIVIGEQCDPKEYYASSFDFKTAWQHLNGACGVPTNIFWHPIRHLVEIEDLQCWTGYFGNELLSPLSLTEKRPFYSKWKKLYLSTMAQRPFITETILPFAYIPALRLLYSSRYKDWFDIRKEILQHLDPAVLEFPRVDHHGDRGHEISNRLYKQVTYDYRNSWYGKKLKSSMPKRPLTTDFCGFWSRWSTASLCEHLLKLGYKLRMGGS